VILRSNASLAVTNLAVANLATANFFAAAGFTACSDFSSLALLASLAFEATAPVSDFFLIAIFVYQSGAKPAQSWVLFVEPEAGIVTRFRAC
jgi:hypothetical protein